MKTTQLLKSVAVATALVVASLSANANTTSTLVLDDIGLTTFSGSSAGKGAFTDIIEFVLTDTAASVFSVSSLNIFGGKTSLSGFSLWSNQDADLYSDDDTLLASGTFGSSGAGSSFSYGALAAGSYFLQVTGLGKSLVGGAYAGSISITPAIPPVPEPETFAMLLAGLGVMGAIARRRKV